MHKSSLIAAGAAILILMGAGCSVPSELLKQAILSSEADKAANTGANDPTKMIQGVPQPVNNFLDSDDVAELNKHGFKVYTGNNPPDMSGTYDLNMKITYDPGTFAGAYPIGFQMSPYVYQFEKVGNKVNASYWSDEVGDQSEDNVGYISGDGKCFTIFIRQTGNAEGCDYIVPQLISACTNTKGLENLNISYLPKSKTGYNCDALAPVNYLRIANDPLASKSSATAPWEY